MTFITSLGTVNTKDDINSAVKFALLKQTLAGALALYIVSNIEENEKQIDPEIQLLLSNECTDIINSECLECIGQTITWEKQMFVKLFQNSDKLPNLNFLHLNEI